MLTWVSLGLVLGASSLVVGWRRLKQTFSPKKPLRVRVKNPEMKAPKPVAVRQRYL